MTRVLIAPQGFKGSLTATEAASAIAAGVARARPDWDLDSLPMSDGGPGFLDALRTAVGAEGITVSAHDALLRPVEAAYLWDAKRGLAAVESAMANGLVLIAEGQRNALAADSFGVGELIAAALAQHPSTLLIGVGGSATTDGGHGMARALGAVFRDEAGRILPPGGAPLADLVRIDWTPPAALHGVVVVVATDVINPLTGPEGAAAVYGPQKGASPENVDALDAALVRYAAVLRGSLGVDVRTITGGGAAGGLAAGLAAFLGARIESGFEIVARVSGLQRRLAAADIVLTGEGSFDSQSLQGKTTGRLQALAEAAAKPCIVFAGTATPGSDALTLASIEPDTEKSMAGAVDLLEELAFLWARDYVGR